MKIIREFWIILMLVYGLVGFSLIRAEESGISRAIACINEGRTDEAIGLLHREIGRDPSIDPSLALGAAYLEKNDYLDAYVTLEKVQRERRR